MASPKQQTYIKALVEDLKAEEPNIPNAVLTKIEQVVAAVHPDLVAVIANADAIPQLKTPTTLLNSSTIIAPEQGRMPIERIIINRARQSSPLCSCSGLGKC